MTPDVIVAGGGLGGLGSAYALATSGLRVRVLERAPAFSEVGAGLQMAPNATRILARWGLLDEAIEAGVLPKRLVFRDALDGRVLTSAAFDEGFVARFDGPYLVIHRSDLLDILVSACRRRGVEMVADCEVIDVTSFDDHVVVHTSQGDQLAAAALGADGLRSTLRRHLSSDEPVASGYVAYRGAFEVSKLDADLVPDNMDEVTVFFGPGCHLVQYSLRNGGVLNTVAVFRSRRFEEGDEDWGTADELKHAFAGACPEVHRGLQVLWQDRRWPMYDRLPIDSWVNGRMALTGDAAHPMLQYLAQGACQALEDAHCLAEEVENAQRRGSPGDWPTIFSRFEEQRVPRTARVQRSARMWGEMWHVDGVSRLVRNELFARRPPGDLTDADWLYGG